MTGNDFFNDGFGQGADFDRVSAREAWYELRERVEVALAERRRSCHGYPLLRPWAWWQFSAPEPRDHSISEAVQLDRLGLTDAALCG